MFKPIADAAIEASMKWLGLDGDVTSGFHNNLYSVTPPDGHGGGGKVTNILGDKAHIDPADSNLPEGFDVATRIYNPWYEAIPAAFEGWTDLPRSEEFTGKIDAMAISTNTLAVEATSDGGSIKGANLDMAGAITTVVTELGKYDGHVIDTFSSMYVNKLTPLVSNQHALAAVLGYHLSVEAALWTHARKDVNSIAKEALAAMKAAHIAAPSPGGLGALIDIVGTVATAASIFNAPLAGAVATATGLLGSFIPETAGNHEKHLPLGAGTPDQVYENMCNALKELNDQISRQEDDIVQKTMSCLTHVSGRNSGFDLASPELLTDDDESQVLTASNQMHYGWDALRAVAHKDIPHLTGLLKQAVSHGESAIGAGPWSRPANIGYGPQGAYSAWAALHDYFIKLVGNTAWELDQGAQQFDVALAQLHASDRDADAALARQSRKVALSDPYDPVSSGTSSGPDGPTGYL